MTNAQTVANYINDKTNGIATVNENVIIVSNGVKNLVKIVCGTWDYKIYDLWTDRDGVAHQHVFKTYYDKTAKQAGNLVSKVVKSLVF